MNPPGMSSPGPGAGEPKPPGKSPPGMRSPGAVSPRSRCSGSLDAATSETRCVDSNSLAERVCPDPEDAAAANGISGNNGPAQPLEFSGCGAGWFASPGTSPGG